MRRYRKKGTALVLAGFIGAGLLTGCAENRTQEPEKVVLHMALVDPENSPYGRGALKIAEEVKKATDGKIEIAVHAGGALGGERETVELAVSNNLDIACVANSVLTNFIPNMAILDQAYLWTSLDQAHAAVDGPVGELIKKEAQEKGFRVVGFMESGFRNVFSTKPIRDIADFRGITIRTMENKYHIAAFKSFGAMPIAMSYNDVFTALQQGTIDAAENAVCNCWNSGFHEVTKHITKSNHAFVYIVLCMSESGWDKIPEDLQDEFLAGVQRGVEAERQYLVEENESATQKLQDAGVQFYDVDVEALQAAYQAQAEKEGFVFDPEWQAAVDEIRSTIKE